MNPPPYHADLPEKTDPARLPLALLQNFFEGVRLEVNARGFCVVAAALVAGHFAATGKAQTVPLLRDEALRYGLTAVLDRRKKEVVFRAFHDPDNAHAETFIRAGGDVFCESCGYQLREHPEDALFNWLRVRCDGRRVKL